MRTPWQSFRLDLERAPVRLWASLGKLEAYGETLAGLPAAPAVADRLTRDWRQRAARGTLYAGNPASGAPGVSGATDPTPADTAPIDPEVADAIAALYDEADRRGCAALTPQTLCADNATLTEIARAAGLLGDADQEATLADQFAGGKGTWSRISQFCAWLNGPDFRAEPGDAIQTAMLQALGAHLYLLRLAPFRHCNEETARLTGYRLLRAAGLPAMAAHLPAAHFDATRDRYAALIGEAADNGGATFAFISYAIAGIGDGLRDQIAALGSAHQQTAWRTTIADTFDGQTRAGDRRRRLLIDALSEADAPVRIGRLRYLSPKLAEAYAGKSAKTLSRDVKWLEQRGLVLRTLQGVSVRVESAGPLAAHAA